jgi:transcriptional regulator with XRE-family HTH domain
MKQASLYSPEHGALIELLRDLRLEAGLSQEQAAKALDRPQTYVSSLEVGQRGLSMIQVRALAALYKVPFAAFVALFEERLKARPYRPPRKVRADAVPKPKKEPQDKVTPTEKKAGKRHR